MSSSESVVTDIQNQHLMSADRKEFLTIKIDGQMFGIPILQVQDVLGEIKVTRIPLAPPQVSGSLHRVCRHPERRQG